MKSSSRGFTLIEILITLLVMVILMSLGVVAFGNLQAQARDEEREADIAAVQRGLEEYFKAGDSRVIAPTQGSYPGVQYFEHIMGANQCGSYAADYASDECYVPDGYAADVLTGVSEDVLTPPNSSTKISTNPTGCDLACLNAKVADGEYVYRPYPAIDDPTDPDGRCLTNCPRYELWYMKETTGEVIKLKSKYQ